MVVVVDVVMAGLGVTTFKYLGSIVRDGSTGIFTPYIVIVAVPPIGHHALLYQINSAECPGSVNEILVTLISAESTDAIDPAVNNKILIWPS